MFKALLRTWRFIDNHPLASRKRLLAIINCIRWQFGSSLLRMPVVFSWIGESKLIIEKGMNGATGNLYAGLHEFYDIAFCLHFLRSGDLFVDVGANIGSFTILASKVVGAKSLTLEPVPKTFSYLQENIRINKIEKLVDSRCCAAGSHHGTIKFSTDRDTTNYVVQENYSGKSMNVPVMPLEELLQELQPSLIKIDVEGYEPEVIRGAEKILKYDSLLAIL